MADRSRLEIEIEIERRLHAPWHATMNESDTDLHGDSQMFTGIHPRYPRSSASKLEGESI